MLQRLRDINREEQKQDLILNLTLDHMLLTNPLQSTFQTDLSTFLFLHEKSLGPGREPLAENYGRVGTGF